MVSLMVKCSYTVKPAEPTPSLRQQWISEPDLITPTTHAPTVYFYPSLPNSIGSPLETLKDSLSQALVYFYPLAGRLHAIPDGRLELDCNGMGVEVFETHTESIIKDFGDFCPTPKLRHLAPLIDYTTPIHEIPLLLVQLTKFKCGGVSIGVAISHIMADGQAALHFISCWSKIARGEKLVDSDKPFLDRTVLRTLLVDQPRRFHHGEFDPPPLLMGRCDDKEERSKETTVAMLKLTKEQVEKLKREANVDLTLNSGIRPYSRYEALSGHIWRCMCKAREHDEEQLTVLRFVINARTRLNPPLPPNYFGNFIFRSIPIAKAGELMKNPLSYAASKMRGGSEMYTDEYVRSAYDYLKRQPDISKLRSGFHTLGCAQGDYLGNPNLAVTSWLGLPINDADFGWGKPIHMGPAAVGFDGKCFVIPIYGDGSLSIALRLQVNHMEAFKDFFYQNL